MLPSCVCSALEISLFFESAFFMLQELRSKQRAGFAFALAFAFPLIGNIYHDTISPASSRTDGSA